MTREQQLELECIELNARLADMTAHYSQAKAQLIRISLENKRAEFKSNADKAKPKEDPAPAPGVD